MTSVVVLFAKKVYIVDQKILSWRHFSQHIKIEKVENDPENNMTNVTVLWFLIVIQVNDCHTLVNLLSKAKHTFCDTIMQIIF